jgi:hypothetical protein
MRTLIVSITMSFLVAAHAAEQKPKTDQQLIDSLKCPETYRDQRAYIEDLAGFLGGAKKSHPDWSDEQLIEFRYKALKAHKCAVSKESNENEI